ncbi:YidH family protein [Nocardioides bruguierae]|uniref:DUF202 domain-containing protein n=1 Tax=Nocardioides bruguierae TaxID=2945102 RepID=A0A9X2D6P9_9ACTN|nr:DUF202 domain-containing protein [Nocardioides bruguierae]MCL8025017.1 DUF202 domain-containing protein [Nocardioides bruguierae]MCM0620176.1 DUF202 domain-containing protein [Nocardioides bruguierae]
MQRWPRWVYGEGEDPDYRFTLANERTFLAWIRTALALIAGAVAVRALDLGLPGWATQALAGVLAVLGMAGGVVAWLRWARGERAMRSNAPLPDNRAGLGLTGGVVLVAAVVVVVLVAVA